MLTSQTVRRRTAAYCTAVTAECYRAGAITQPVVWFVTPYPCCYCCWSADDDDDDDDDDVDSCYSRRSVSRVSLGLVLPKTVAVIGQSRHCEPGQRLVASSLWQPCCCCCCCCCSVWMYAVIHHLSGFIFRLAASERRSYTRRPSTGDVSLIRATLTKTTDLSLFITTDTIELKL